MSIVHKPAEQDGFQLLWKCTFQSLFTAAAAPQGGRQYTHTQHQAQKHVKLAKNGDKGRKYL